MLKLLPAPSFISKMAKDPVAKKSKGSEQSTPKSKKKVPVSKASKASSAKANKASAIVQYPPGTAPVSSRSRSKRVLDATPFPEGSVKKIKTTLIDVKPTRRMLKDTEDVSESDDEVLKEISREEALGSSANLAEGEGASSMEDSALQPVIEADSCHSPLPSKNDDATTDALPTFTKATGIKVADALLDSSITNVPEITPVPIENIEEMLTNMEKLLDVSSFSSTDVSSLATTPEVLSELEQKLQGILAQPFEVVIMGPELNNLFEVISAIKHHPEIPDTMKLKLSMVDDVFVHAPAYQTIKKSQQEVEDFMNETSKLQMEFSGLSREYVIKQTPVLEALQQLSATQEELASVRKGIEDLKKKEVELMDTLLQQSEAKMIVEEEFGQVQKNICALNSKVKSRSSKVNSMKQANERFLKIQQQLANSWTRAYQAFQ